MPLSRAQKKRLKNKILKFFIISFINTEEYKLKNKSGLEVRCILLFFIVFFINYIQFYFKYCYMCVCVCVRMRASCYFSFLNEVNNGFAYSTKSSINTGQAPNLI